MTQSLPRKSTSDPQQEQRLDALLDEITRLRAFLTPDQLREYDRRYHGLDRERE